MTVVPAIVHNQHYIFTKSYPTNNIIFFVGDENLYELIFNTPYGYKCKNIETKKAEEEARAKAEAARIEEEKRIAEEKRIEEEKKAAEAAAAPGS